jgi:hypothetical protein
MTTLALEIANADNVLKNELPSARVNPNRGSFLVETAKKLQRLQTKAARLRKELKATEAAIRSTKKDLKYASTLIGGGK